MHKAGRSCASSRVSNVGVLQAETCAWHSPNHACRHKHSRDSCYWFCYCSAVIKDFCKQLGVDNKQVQGVIRLAKKNGEKLGFLA